MNRTKQNTEIIFSNNSVKYYQIAGPFEGSFAKIYNVYREPALEYFGHDIALKVFKKNKDKELCASEEFKGIIALARNLKQPHGNWNLNGLVPILSDGFIEVVDNVGEIYKAIEYQWIGEPFFTLKKYINRFGPFSHKNFKPAFYSICRIIEWLHENGIVHRDIHEDNIFVDQFNVAKVLLFDYGYLRINPAYLSSKEKLIKKYNTSEEISCVCDTIELGKLLHFLLIGQKYKGRPDDAIPESLNLIIENACDGEYKTINSLETDIYSEISPNDKLVSLPFSNSKESKSHKVYNFSQNPFYYGGAVPDAMFYGRKQLLQTIIARTTGTFLQPISFVGDRRIGKSSLLKKLQFILNGAESNGKVYLCLYLDMMKGSSTTCKDLMQKIRYEITKVDKEPWDRSNDGNLVFFDRAVENLYDRNIFLVLLLDEFENITNHPDEFKDFLKDLRANCSEGIMSIVTATNKPLAELWELDDIISPFFNIFIQEYIGLLGSESSIALIKDNMDVDKAELDFIIKMSGNHPFFLQMVASRLWEGKKFGKDDFKNLGNLIYNEMKLHFHHYWEKYSSNDRNALLYLTGKKVEKPSDAIINRLELRGVISNGRPFSEPFSYFLNKVN